MCWVQCQDFSIALNQSGYIWTWARRWKSLSSCNLHYWHAFVKVHGNQKLSGAPTLRDSSKLGCSCGIRKSSIITEWKGGNWLTSLFSVTATWNKQKVYGIKKGGKKQIAKGAGWPKIRTLVLPFCRNGTYISEGIYEWILWKLHPFPCTWHILVQVRMLRVYRTTNKALQVSCWGSTTWNDKLPAFENNCDYVIGILDVQACLK